MKNLSTEKWFNEIIRHQGKEGARVISEQIKAFISMPEMVLDKIGEYYILDINFYNKNKKNIPMDYFCVSSCGLKFKSFQEKQNAIDYCLDKMNWETKQIELL